jgi:hypothetical protein
VAPTHEEIEHATEAIRAHRKTAGELTNGTATDRYVSLQFTQAQKSDPRNYRSGQVLVYHRALKNVAKNEPLEVVRVADRKIVARLENGAERELTLRHGRSFDVFERRSIEVAPGDRLLITANRKDRDFKATNGELVTVSGFDPRGRIQLQDGRTLPANFKQFTHGYAVTAHRSQGKTVDALVIAADSMHKELFQVAATRGREHIQIVTGNKEALKKSIGISDERQSVTELVNKIESSKARSSTRQNHGFAAARQEALSTPAYVGSNELEDRNQAQHNIGPIQQRNSGIEHGIHP